MGDRRKARSRIRNARAKERWALALVLVITCVPLLATLFAIVSTTEPDLSDFTPINPRVGNYLLLNWSELREGHLLTPSSVPTEYTDALVQVLGYMTEGDGPTLTGELIRDFVLLPEVGDALHPANRFGDQMVAVHLREGNQVQYSPKTLVTLWGTFRAWPGDPTGPKPLYHLEDARAQPADSADIHKYFK
jgi:hypothetical protein